MTDLEMWNLVTGFISATLVLPLVQQPRWSVSARAALTFAYCMVVGLVSAYLTGQLDGVHDLRDAVSSVLLLLVATIATYKGFAKPVGIAPAIESATSSRPRHLE